MAGWYIKLALPENIRVYMEGVEWGNIEKAIEKMRNDIRQDN